MEKRAILAIVITFLIIFAWSFIQQQLFPPPSSPPVKEVRKEEVTAPEKKGEIKKLEPGEGKGARDQKRPGKSKSVIEKEVSVETQNYVAVFTSEDARLKHFRLKKFEDRVKESPMTISIKGAIQSILGKKQEVIPDPLPLDLVNTGEGGTLPLGLVLADTDLSSSEGNWEVEKDQIRLLNEGEKGEILFSKTLESGLKLIKRYRFTSDSYSMDLEVEIQNNSAKEIKDQLGIEWTGKVELAKLADEGNKDFGLRYAFLKNNKVETKDLGGTGSAGCTPSCEPQKKTVDPFEISDRGDIRWFSYGGEYFTVVLIPPSSKDNNLSVKGTEKNLLKAVVAAPSFSLSPQNSVKFPYRLYLGPKEEGLLKGLGVEAEKIVDFGWFTIVAKPLLWLLKFTNRVTNNFGIDILILSILIKVIFLPLTQISMKSMKEMQKVQPEMNRLRETYKNDKARLQQEIMLLYKRRRINPMSGCLPMVIQIPVFIALYNALQNAIEMRHAPFFLWIQDLAAKDPIYVTPIIMGASMVLQQKMTPTTADPAQAKMFLLMPVMFTFLFLNFPAGLVLYWLVNNVLSIAHQYYLNKKA